jgi:hypothetical protein
MPAITPTAATPLPPRPVVGGAGTSGESPRLKIAHWLEAKFGRAALPVAAVAGGVVGGTLGMLTLGPVGALAGGAAGAFFGGVLFMAG